MATQEGFWEWYFYGKAGEKKSLIETTWDGTNRVSNFFATVDNAAKCECGAEKCRSNIHSSWCPKAE